MDKHCVCGLPIGWNDDEDDAAFQNVWLVDASIYDSTVTHTRQQNISTPQLENTTKKSARKQYKKVSLMPRVHKYGMRLHKSVKR